MKTFIKRYSKLSIIILFFNSVVSLSILLNVGNLLYVYKVSYILINFKNN